MSLVLNNIIFGFLFLIMFKKFDLSFPWVVTENKKKAFECIICLSDFNTANEPAFDTGECEHKACQDCLRAYFWGALTDNNYKDYTYLQCPGTNCDKKYLSQEVIPVIFTSDEGTDWWASALSSKAYIVNKARRSLVYSELIVLVINHTLHKQVTCPHTGCTGVFDAEDDHTKQCTFAECYQCHKGLCITCQTAWHPGKYCYNEMLALSTIYINSNSILDKIKVQDSSLSLKETLQTAKTQKWCQCPFCSNLVERTVSLFFANIYSCFIYT